LNVGTSIRAVVFDFDGTLAKLNINFPHMRRAVCDLIESYHIPLDKLDNLFVLEMIDEAEALIALQHPGEKNHFKEHAHSLIANIELEAAKKGELIDGTRDMLRNLKNREIKTGVVTRNCLSAVTCVFSDIHAYCEVVVTREMTRKVKPHPEHLLTALTLLDITPECATMVGDHPMDITLGKEVGTLTIGVLSGYSSSNDLIEAGADIIIATAAGILDVLP
jgi:phosphoglycolate phosphatase